MKIIEKFLSILKTYYYRPLIWTGLTFISIYILSIIYINTKINETFLHNVFITTDIDSIRYLVSAVFQGLSSLFGIIISIAFITTQWLSLSYSNRLVFWILRKRWFSFGVSLFLITILFNFIILTIIDNQVIDRLGLLLAMDIILISVSLFYLFYFIYLFIDNLHPMKFAKNIIDKFEKDFYVTSEKRLHEDNFKLTNSLSLLQTTFIKVIKSGDTDMAIRMLNTVTDTLCDKITENNYEDISQHLAPCLDKIINVAQEYREYQFIENVLFSIEKIHDKVIPIDFIKKIGKFNTEKSLFDLIHSIIKIAVETKNRNLLRSCLFGSLARLTKKYFNIIPNDEDMSRFIGLEKKAEAEHFKNDHVLGFVENIFIDYPADIAIESLKCETKITSNVIRYLVQLKYTILDFDDKKIETKKNLLYSIIFKINEIVDVAKNKKINIFSNIITSFSWTLDSLKFDLNLSISMLNLMLNSFKIMVDKNLYNYDSTFSLNHIAAEIRGVINRKDREYSILIENTLNFFEDTLVIINKKMESSIDPVLNELKKEIATQLLSFKDWGIDQFGFILDYKIDEILAKNWSLEELDV